MAVQWQCRSALVFLDLQWSLARAVGGISWANAFDLTGGSHAPLMTKAESHESTDKQASIRTVGVCLFTALRGLGCAAESPDPAELSASSLQLSAAGDAGVTDSAVHGGKLLSREELTALLGDKVPSALGTCPEDAGVVPCAPTIYAIKRPCGGFTDVCDSTGTEDVLPVNFFCILGTCRAISDQVEQTIACAVPTDGRPCATGCGDPFCLPYSTECDQQTSQVRSCASGGVCANDTCANQTVTQETVGTCTRDTEGQTCHPFNLCEKGTFPLCNVNGVCACLLGRQ